MLHNSFVPKMQVAVHSEMWVPICRTRGRHWTTISNSKDWLVIFEVPGSNTGRDNAILIVVFRGFPLEKIRDSNSNNIKSALFCILLNSISICQKVSLYDLRCRHFNPPKPSRYCMCTTWNIQKIYVLPTERINVFCVDLRTNNVCFPVKQCLVVIIVRKCFLRGTS